MRWLIPIVLATGCLASAAPAAEYLVASLAGSSPRQIEGPPLDVGSEPRNFVIRAGWSGKQLEDLQRRCETLRSQLQQRWLGAQHCRPWSPPCQLVVHTTRASYSRCVGPGATSSMGSSLVRMDKTGIASRRVDLLVDASGQLPALAHEIAHVVLADYFQGWPPPRWADEGIAMLADPESKRALHRRDCERALRSGSSLRLVELMTLVEFAKSNQVPAFYGQSLTLVEFLSERYEPQRLLPFLAAAQTDGYDQALRAHYGLADVGQLERVWRQHMLANRLAGS